MTRLERATRNLVAVLLFVGGTTALYNGSAIGAVPLILGALLAVDMP